MNKKRLSVRIHPAGIAAVCAALLFGRSTEVLAILSAILWHEAAHAAALICCCRERCTIELTPFGGMADPKAFERMSPLRQAVCAGAGVLASLVGAWMCTVFCTRSAFYQALQQGHVSLALVNSLPAWPLDGARVLMAVSAFFGKERVMRKCLCRFSYILALLMVLAALWGAYHGMVNLSLLTAGPYLCYAACQGQAACSLRKIQALQGKLNEGVCIPVQASACTDQNLKERIAMMVSGWPQNRYQLLFQLDRTGHVMRMWTETEMLDEVMNMESIGRQSNVDKAKDL